MIFYRLVWLSGLIVVLCGASAWADGGALRVSEQSGKYRISVFTDPTPLRIGVADISVLIQDTTKQDAIATLPTQVIITPLDQSTGEIRAIATASAATNKLFLASVVNLLTPGISVVEVICSDAGHEHRVQFETNVEPQLPHWLSLWPWFSWPIVVAAVWFLLRSPASSRP